MSSRATRAASSYTSSADARGLVVDVFRRRARALEHLEAVVRGVEPMDFGSRQGGDHLREQLALGELVARSGEKQHRLPDLAQVSGAFHVRLARHVQRKRAEDQARRFERVVRHRVRRHAPAERMPADPERQLRARPRVRGRLRDRRRGYFRPIGAALARLHVRKVEAQRRDPALAERVGERLHVPVLHARARAMREHERGHRIVRTLPQRSHAAKYSRARSAAPRRCVRDGRTSKGPPETRRKSIQCGSRGTSAKGRQARQPAPHS